MTPHNAFADSPLGRTKIFLATFWSFRNRDEWWLQDVHVHMSRLNSLLGKLSQNAKLSGSIVPNSVEIQSRSREHILKRDTWNTSSHCKKNMFTPVQRKYKTHCVRPMANGMWPSVKMAHAHEATGFLRPSAKFIERKRKLLKVSTQFIKNYELSNVRRKEHI